MSIYANRVGIWVSNNADFAGNQPPFDKILASDLHIQSVYVNGTGTEDKFVVPALMDKIRSKGLLACAWFVPRSTDALAEASKASLMVTRLNPDAVMMDVETHDLVFQRAFIAEYRRLKPGRATDWTCEPRQSEGTVAIFEILAARMDLFVQLYRGDMRESDPKHELRYWTSLIPWERIHFFYDARTDWWNLDEGLLFDAERLP